MSCQWESNTGVVNTYTDIGVQERSDFSDKLELSTDIYDAIGIYDDPNQTYDGMLSSVIYTDNTATSKAWTDGFTLWLEGVNNLVLETGVVSIYTDGSGVTKVWTDQLSLAGANFEDLLARTKIWADRAELSTDTYDAVGIYDDPNQTYDGMLSQVLSDDWEAVLKEWTDLIVVAVCDTAYYFQTTAGINLYTTGGIQIVTK